MKVDAFLGALRAMPLSDPSTLTGGRPFLVLSPHPDDESLGCGGLIAAACHLGIAATVVVLTDGAGSHPNSRAYPPARVVALRQAEAARAVAHLGLPAGRLTHLGLPDAQAPSRGPLFDGTVDRIAGLAAASGAESIFVTWGHDPHCDHQAADAMARALRRRQPGLALWSYPIWGWHLDPETEIDAPPPKGYRLAMGPWAAAKQAAIAAHESQMSDLITDDPRGFRFDGRTIAPFEAPFEYFFEVPR